MALLPDAIVPSQLLAGLPAELFLTYMDLQGPGCPGGRQVNHEPAVCPGCQESQWDPGVHQEECG